MSEISQPPLFDFSYLEYFDLKFTSSASDWDRFLEEFLIVRYAYFRDCFQKNNINFFTFFLNLLEGNFLILKCDLINDAFCSLKRNLLSDEIDSKKLENAIPDYLQIVNIGRIVIVHLIKTLYKAGVQLNGEIIQKYMKVDSDLDTTEKLNIKNKIMSFNYIKSKMPINDENIGKFINFNNLINFICIYNLY